MTLEQAIRAAQERLAVCSDSPRIDAELLLCHVLGQKRVYLYTWPERELTPEQQTRYSDLLGRRAAGEPVAHLTGEREFWSLPLRVSAATLIPRPETELLVEQALARIPPEAAWRIADLGTGSGAIALAITSERPHCQLVAVERSAGALAVAEENARQLGLANIDFRLGDWFAPLAGEHFQLIASNPPYIPDSDPHLMQGDVRFEPLTALASGPDGLDDIRQLIAAAPRHLVAGGWLLLEHGYDQGDAVLALLSAGGFCDGVDYRDFQGHGRVAEGRWPGA